MLPTLQRVAGPSRVLLIPPVLGAEDFAFFQQKVPGLFFFVGVRPPSTPAEAAAPNHSPGFFVDEAGLSLGIRSLSEITMDFLSGAGS
jgi:metal-dependent amidase/aminoacylase/carboxypeptidase family protein